MDWEIMTLISRSIVVPSIFLYYIQTKNNKLDFLPLVLCSLYFIGEIIIQTKPENSLSWLSSIYIFSYFLITYRVIQSFDFIALLSKSKPFYYRSIFILFILIFIFFETLDLIFLLNFEYKFLFITCAFILLILASFTWIQLLMNKSKANKILFTTVVLFIVSDLFFALQLYYVEFFIIQFIATVTQTLTYLFVIKFFLEKEKY